MYPRSFGNYEPWQSLFFTAHSFKFSDSPSSEVTLMVTESPVILLVLGTQEDQTYFKQGDAPHGLRLNNHPEGRLSL